MIPFGHSGLCRGAPCFLRIPVPAPAEDRWTEVGGTWGISEPPPIYWNHDTRIPRPNRAVMDSLDRLPTSSLIKEGQGIFLAATQCPDSIPFDDPGSLTIGPQLASCYKAYGHPGEHVAGVSGHHILRWN